MYRFHRLSMVLLVHACIKRGNPPSLDHRNRPFSAGLQTGTVSSQRCRQKCLQTLRGSHIQIFALLIPPFRVWKHKLPLLKFILFPAIPGASSAEFSQTADIFPCVFTLPLPRREGSKQHFTGNRGSRRSHPDTSRLSYGSVRTIFRNQSLARW